MTATLVAWSTVPSEPADVKLWSVRNLFLLLAYFAIYLMLALSGIVNLVGHKIALPRRLTAASLLILLILFGRWFQLYSELGVFALGGSRYWVQRAAEAKEREKAKAALRVVLSATQYGLNAAETEVLTRYSPEEQRRLFILLSEATNNERWKERYLDHAR